MARWRRVIWGNYFILEAALALDGRLDLGGQEHDAREGEEEHRDRDADGRCATRRAQRGRAGRKMFLHSYASRSMNV